MIDDFDDFLALALTEFPLLALAAICFCVLGIVIVVSTGSVFAAASGLLASLFFAGLLHAVVRLIPRPALPDAPSRSEASTTA